MQPTSRRATKRWRFKGPFRTLAAKHLIRNLNIGDQLAVHRSAWTGMLEDSPERARSQNPIVMVPPGIAQD